MAELLPRIRGNGFKEQVAHLCHLFLVRHTCLITSALIRTLERSLVFRVRRR